MADTTYNIEVRLALKRIQDTQTGVKKISKGLDDVKKSADKAQASLDRLAAKNASTAAREASRAQREAVRGQAAASRIAAQQQMRAQSEAVRAQAAASRIAAKNETRAQRESARIHKQSQRDSAKRMRDLRAQSESSRASFGKLAGSVAAVGVAYIGISTVTRGLMGATREAFKFNSELEATKIGMAAVIGAVNNISFSKAMVPTEKVFEQLKEDAIKSVATTKELFSIFQYIVGPISAAGFGLEKVRELTNATVSAASALNVDFPQAQRDIGQMVRGTAGMDVKLFSILRSTGAIKENAEQWNKSLSAQERVAKLSSALGKFSVAANAYGKSMRGVTSTFSDITEQFRDTLAGPALNAFKNFLDTINTKLIANREQITAYLNQAGTRLGEVITSAFGKMQKGFEYVSTHWEELTQKFRNMAEVLRRSAIALAAVQFVGAIGAGATGAGVAGGIVPGLATVGSAVGGVAAGVAGAAGIGGLAAVLLPLAGVVLVVSTNFEAFLTMFNNFLPILNVIGAYFRRLFDLLWQITGPLFKLMGISAITVIFGALLIVLKTVETWLQLVTWGWGKVADALRPVTEWVDVLVKKLSAFLGVGAGVAANDLFGVGKGASVAPQQDSWAAYQREFSAQPKARAMGTSLESLSAGAPKTKTINDFRGSKISVKQEFKQADPNRIMLQMIDGINRQADARTQSGYIPAISR